MRHARPRGATRVHEIPAHYDDAENEVLWWELGERWKLLPLNRAESKTVSDALMLLRDRMHPYAFERLLRVFVDGLPDLPLP